MDAATILVESEMSQARSPTELRNWVLGKCEELAASPEAKAFACSGARLSNKFYDEIYPLSVYASLQYGDRSDVLVQPNLSNDNFDATILGDNGKRFVEVTYAKEGYDLSLRIEVLAREGHVCMTGPVFVCGRRGTPDRLVSVEPYALSHVDIVRAHLSLIEARVANKSRAIYGKEHLLLVAVDDYLALTEQPDCALLEERIELWLSEYPLNFGRIVFVGMAGRLFVSRNLLLNRA
jgi:hypothetical protein